jgi:dTDP-glucose 4,6-dehydratase
MNLLVTGGCGFIGSNFIRQRLAEQDSPLQRLVNLDLLTYAGNPANLAGVDTDPRYVFVHGDIGDRALVEDLLKQQRINAVAHFAAESHVDRSIDSPEPFVQTNVVGTLRLLDAARNYWRGLGEAEKKLFRFLHISTDEVFGDLPPASQPATEDSPYAPNSPYAAAKAASDHLVRAYGRTYQLPVLTIHATNNFGPRQFPEKLVPLAILNALENKPIPVYGDGQQVRDWIYVEDHCAAAWRVLREGKVGESYNVGAGHSLPNLEVVRQICAQLDIRAPRPDGGSCAAQIGFVADRPGHDRRYACATAKIRRELGWAPVETFASGVAKTVEWYLTNRPWCDAITRRKYARERLGAPPTSP